MSGGRALVVLWPGGGIEPRGVGRAGLELVAAAREVAAVVEVVAAGESHEEAGSKAYLEAIERAVRDGGFDVVVLPADARGAELCPRLAARLDGCALTDVVGVACGEGETTWLRPCFGGKAVAEVVSRRSPTVVTVRPRAFEPVLPLPGDPVPLPAATATGAVRRIGLEAPAPSDGVRLEDARLVVSGGRGIGSRELFERLQELAGLLGGAVGSSAAAIDEGWAPGHLTVGMTGKVVGAETYVAIGISGASHHLAGASGARNLVAINADASAPVFRYATLGAVLDAAEAVPALIEELRRLSEG